MIQDNSQCYNDSSKRHAGKERRSSLQENPRRFAGVNVVTYYMSKLKELGAFDKIAEWVNKQIEEGNEEIILKTIMAVNTGKYGKNADKRDS